MLNDPLQAGFENVDLVGFAIRRPGPEQYHVGLLYKVPGKPVRLRHQCDHLDIKDKEPDNPEYLWTDVAALSSLNKRLIANKMSRAGGDKVPYGVGFRVDGKYLDKKTLKYAVTELGEGLTCATYIVAVMETLGFFPFDRKGWTSTPEDTNWQKAMISRKAAEHPTAVKHFEAEKAHIGESRFRPEHVVAAGYPPTWPLTQAVANELAGKIVAFYNQKRP
jgi:hypothetical protein